MRFEEYLIEQGKSEATDKTTVFHEIGTAIFCVEPNAEIETGGDLREYLDEGVVEAAYTTADRDIDAIEDIDNALTQKQLQLLSDETEAPAKVINDAKKLASALLDVTGSPQGTVYGTGPTNDASKYGAADIAYRVGGKFYPISLKYGSGQLKNLTLNTLGEVIMEGVLGDNEKLGDVIFGRENQKYGDRLAFGFVGVIRKYFENVVEDSGELKIINRILDRLGKGGGDKYQESKVSDVVKNEEEEGVFRKYIDKFVEERKSELIKQVFIGIFSNYSKKDKSLRKRGGDVKQRVFETLFGNYFEEVDKKDKIEKNLAEFFRKQMSAGAYDMGYGAEGGKKILFIPNRDSFDERVRDFDFQLDSKSTRSGYILNLRVRSGDEEVVLIQIEVTIRGKQGEMNGKPDPISKISNKVDSEKWNSIFT